MKSELSISTPEIKKRVVIISQADKLNIESQNALLKILEEPRDDILFILETPTLETILPTIKSRCWIINFSPLNITDIKEYLLYRFANKINQNLIDKILSNYNGENLYLIIDEIFKLINSSSPDKILENENEGSTINIIELFRYIYLSNFQKSLDYIDKFNILSDRNEAILFINDILKFSHLLLKTKLSEENKETELIKLSKVIDEEIFQNVIEYLTNAKNYVENYVNLNLVFIKLFLLIKNSFIKN